MITPSSPGHLNEVKKPPPGMENTALMFPRKEKWDWKTTTKTINSSGSSGKSFCILDPFASACESFNRKKHGADSAGERFQAPLRPLLAVAPPLPLHLASVLLSHCGETGRDFINKNDWGHT